MTGLVVPLPSDADARVEATIDVMRATIDHAPEWPEVRALANIASMHRGGPIAGVWALLKAWVRFRRDPPGVEFPARPDRLAAAILKGRAVQGDCDDVAVLGGSLLRALGIRPALIVMGRSESGPYEHVYFGAVVDGRLIPLDPQETDRLGAELPSRRRRVWTL